MRKQLLIGLSFLAMILVVRNLYVMFVDLPDEVQQGPIFRIIFFHVPAAWTALLCALLAAIASVMYLVGVGSAADIDARLRTAVRGLSDAAACDR